MNHSMASARIRALACAVTKEVRTGAVRVLWRGVTAHGNPSGTLQFARLWKLPSHRAQ
jgi:hypothetical protein